METGHLPSGYDSQFAMENSSIFKFGKPSYFDEWAIEKPWQTVNVITRLGMSSNPPNSWYFEWISPSGIRLSREAPERESALVQQRVVSSILGDPVSWEPSWDSKDHGYPTW